MSTRSPSKKEKPERGVPVQGAPGAAVLTRKSSAVLHTRQLRRKEGSIRKISEMTQMLLTPITELTPKVRIKRSPKDKSAEKRDTDKKGEVKEGVRRRGRRGRKRGAGATSKGAEAALAAPTAPAPAPAGAGAGAALTVRELVALADAQELTDDDLMEILTCDSPVWWEDPPDATYLEDPIDPEMLLEAPPYSRPAPAPAAITLTAANTKHIDYKFMKKRLKLENVLGNLKGKMKIGSLANANATKQRTESELHLNKIGKDIDETMAVVSIKNESEETPAAREEERGVKRVKKSSESTEGEGEGEGDSIQGLGNEDMLRHLEDMDIPVEPEGMPAPTAAQVKTEGGLDKAYVISDNSQGVDVEEAETVPRSDAHVAAAVTGNSTSSGLSHREDKKVEIEEKSSISSAENVLPSKDPRDTISIVSNTLSDAVSVTSYTASNTVSDTVHSSSPTNGTELPDGDNPLNSDSQYSEDDQAVDEKIGRDIGVDALTDLSDSDRENSDGLDNAERETDKKFEPDAKPAETCNRNSKDDKVIEESHDDVTAKENTSNDDSQEDKITENSKKEYCNGVNNTENDESATKNDTNIKQTNKTNKLNKEQLKAVYKTIVDTGFVHDLNENAKMDTLTENPIITTDKNIENVATFYKKCKNIRTKKTEATSNETGSIDQDTDLQEISKNKDVTEENHDVKNSCSCSRGSDIRSTQFSIIPDAGSGGAGGSGRSAKYCMQCSSIFETDTCCYCERRLLSEAPSNHPCGAGAGACSYKVL